MARDKSGNEYIVDHTASQAPEPALAEGSDTDQEEGGGRRMDAEIKVMSALVRILDTVPDTTRPRIVRWLADRYTTAPVD